MYRKVYSYITLIISTDKLFERISQIHSKIPLTESFSYVIVAGQMTGNIIQKKIFITDTFL